MKSEKDAKAICYIPPALRSKKSIPQSSTNSITCRANSKAIEAEETSQKLANQQSHQILTKAKHP
jgi:hypothetical protein